MLRRSRKEITQINPTAVDPEHLALAQQIAEMAHQTALDETVDVARAMSEHVDALVAQERGRIIMQAYRALNPLDQMQVLQTTFGDEQLRQVLDAERQRITEMNAFTDAIEVLRQEASQTDCVDLTKIPLGAIVELSLYDTDDYDEAETRSSLEEEYDLIRYIRGPIIEAGRVHVLENYFMDDLEAPKPRVKLSQSVQFGVQRDNGAKAELVPSLFYGAPVDYLHKEKIYELRAEDMQSEYALVLGQLTINDVDMF